MKNGLFTLDWGSIIDAVVMAVFSAVILALANVASSSGFDVFSADWKTIGEHMVNLGFVVGVVTLAKDFLSTNSGSVLNITPDTEVKG